MLQDKEVSLRFHRALLDTSQRHLPEFAVCSPAIQRLGPRSPHTGYFLQPASMRPILTHPQFERDCERNSNMTIPAFALNYDKCTGLELRAFIKARIPGASSADVAAKIRESGHVAVMYELDHRATFRFMDLMPELRVMVYEQLLIKASGVWRIQGNALTVDLQNTQPRSRLFPAILRTCRKVYEEASEVLHSNNPTDLDLRLSPNDMTANIYIDEGRTYTYFYPATEGLQKHVHSIKSRRNLRINALFCQLPEFCAMSVRRKPYRALDLILRTLVNVCEKLQRVAICVTGGARESLDLHVEPSNANVARLRDTIIKSTISLAQLPQDCALAFEGIDAEMIEGIQNMIAKQRTGVDGSKDDEWPALPTRAK